MKTKEQTYFRRKAWRARTYGTEIHKRNLEYRRRWYQKNRERLLIKRKEWYESHKDKINKDRTHERKRKQAKARQWKFVPLEF